MNDLPLTVLQFKNYLENKNRSQNTIINYISDIMLFFKWLQEKHNTEDFKKVDAKISFQYENYLTAIKKSPASRARKISSLKSYFDFLKSKKIISENPMEEMATPKLGKKLPKFLTEEECEKLLSVIDGKYKERDYAIITVFLTCGIRLSELTGITLDSIKNDNLTVFGKGAKERNIPLIPMCIEAINDYLKVRPKTQSNSLFLSHEKTGISNQMVSVIVKKYLKKIGKGNLSCHKLRHSCFSILYANGVDLIEIANIAGHESIATSQIYVHVNNEKIRSAVNKNPLANIKNKRRKKYE